MQQALSRIEQIIEDTADTTLYGKVSEPPDVRVFRDLIQGSWNSIPAESATVVTPHPVWNIRAHGGRLGQLLENLFSNAIKHVGDDVTVRVGILDNETGFYVEDDGPGIPDAVKTRLETPSELSRERGSGYGLQIVEKVVSEHGWKMEISDAACGGARFEFDNVAIFK